MKIHFEPDYQFTNPMHRPAEERAQARDDLREEQEDMKGKFSPQIMIDSEPAAERTWDAACEQFCGKRLRDGVPGAYEGDGIIVVKSDPAPWKGGGYKSLTQKVRQDGTKDEWAIDVWRVRIRGRLKEYVLLYGEASFEWGEEQGSARAAYMMDRFRTTLFFSEDPDLWHPYMVKATRTLGIGLRKAEDGGPMKYGIYNKADRKNVAISALGDANREGLVYICDETCPGDYLYGDKEHTGFLTQLRKHRRVDNRAGHNLRFDDRADLGSRVMDPAISEIAPTEDLAGVEEIEAFWEDDTPRRSRYCAL